MRETGVEDNTGSCFKSFRRKAPTNPQSIKAE